MPNKTLAVTPGTGTTINTLPDVGQATSANSLPVVLASDQGAITIQGAVTVSDGTGPLTVDGTVNVGTLPALAAGTNAIGTVTVSNLPTLGQKAASGSVSTDQASNGVIATAYGTLADTTTSDPSASGASLTFSSLFKGIAANGLALLSRLPTTLGAKASSASLSMTPATDAVFAAPADQDPIFNHTAGVKVTATTSSAALITPPAGCKYLRVSCDADVVVNTANATAADDGTAIRLVANSPEVIPVVAGTAVTVLALSATAVVRATPLKTRS